MKNNAYRLRVPLLLGLFFMAMIENNRHPFPLWGYLYRLLTGSEVPISTFSRHFLLMIPLGLYTLSLLVRLSGTATLGRKSVWALLPRSDSVVREGLFGHLRHPLYLGSAGMILSLSIMSSPQGAILLTGIGIPFLVFLSHHEEQDLLRKFPDYLEYMKKVPPFIPRFRSLKSFFRALFIPLRNCLGSSLRSESANVALLGGFCAFWATPNLSIFWIVFFAALALSVSAPIWIPEEREES